MAIVTYTDKIAEFDPGAEHIWMLQEATGNYLDEGAAVAVDSVAVSAGVNRNGAILVDDFPRSARPGSGDEYIDFGNNETAVSTGAGTLALWIYPFTFGIVTGRQVMIGASTADAGPASYWALSYDGTTGALKLQIIESVGVDDVTHDIANNNLTANAINFVAVTADGTGNLKFYLNGSVIGTGDITITTNGITYTGASWLGDLEGAAVLDGFNMLALEVASAARADGMWGQMAGVVISETEWTGTNVLDAYNAGLDAGVADPVVIPGSSKMILHRVTRRYYQNGHGS
jgi:hypothetical protein